MNGIEGAYVYRKWRPTIADNRKMEGNKIEKKQLQYRGIKRQQPTKIIRILEIIWPKLICMRHY
jgi:hypothetical protein